MRSWINRSILIFVLVVAMQPATALGQDEKAAPSPSLRVLDSTNTLAVSGEEDEDTATGYFTLFNPSPKAVKIDVTFQAASSEKVTIDSVTPLQVKPGKAQRIGVTFGGLDELDAAATGQLIVTGGKTPASQAVTVSPAPHPSLPWSPILIGGSFALALLMMGIVVMTMPGNNRSSLRNPAPGPKWSFDSWATTLTAAGAIVGTVLSDSTFPSFPAEISKESLVNMNIFFGILVVLGPFLFQALRKSGIDATAEAEGQVGTNGTLLIASSITIWAVLGQLGAFALLGWELLGGETMATLAVVGVFLIALLALRYYWVTMSSLVTREWPLTPTADAKEMAAATRPLDTSEVDRLFLSTAVYGAEMRRLPDERSAEVVLPPSEPGPQSWSLL